MFYTKKGQSGLTSKREWNFEIGTASKMMTLSKVLVLKRRQIYFVCTDSPVNLL